MPPRKVGAKGWSKKDKKKVEVYTADGFSAGAIQKLHPSMVSELDKDAAEEDQKADEGRRRRRRRRRRRGPSPRRGGP